MFPRRLSLMSDEKNSTRQLLLGCVALPPPAAIAIWDLNTWTFASASRGGRVMECPPVRLYSQSEDGAVRVKIVVAILLGA
jgi:hypothetical protein